MREESFSFTLRRAETREDLLRACRVRAEAYGYKVPAYRESMAQPDAVDASPGTTVFLCEDKISGDAVGTMRVQTRELEIEKYVELPTYVGRATRCEVTRLSAPVGADPFVRLALWKAAYLFGIDLGITWIVMTVRKPALIRAYEKMGARDLFLDRNDGFVLPYVGNLPHRIYALDLDNFYDHWNECKHPLLEFMTATKHRDISILPALMERRAREQLGL